MLIRERMNSIEKTESESVIIGYFQSNIDKLSKESARGIAKKLYCSPSTIVRLCQKLGFTGFEDFKLQYIKECNYLDESFKHIDPNKPFTKDDSIHSIACRLDSLYKETIDDTCSLLENGNIELALNILLRNKNICIVAASAQIGAAMSFQDKMSKIGKHITIYSSTDDAYYEAAYTKKGDTCFILISYTGETERCIRVAKKLNEVGGEFISITSYGTNTLTELSNCCLFVSTREKIRDNVGRYAMTLSTMYLLDLLYSIYFTTNYDENYQKHLELVEEFESYKTQYSRHTDNSLIK